MTKRGQAQWAPNIKKIKWGKNNLTQQKSDFFKIPLKPCCLSILIPDFFSLFLLY